MFVQTNRTDYSLEMLTMSDSPRAPTSTPRYRRAILLACAVAVVAGLLRLGTLIPACAQRNDFAHYYVSSRALLDGENPYTVSLADRYAALGMEFDERIPNATNPPALLWLVAPLAALPPGPACAVWHLVQFASLALTFFLVWRLTRNVVPAGLLAAGAAAVVFSNPLYWHVYHSQVQLLLGAMLVAAFWWHQQRKHNLACATIVAAGALKLFPLALLPWFLFSTGERWPVRFIRAGTMTILAAVLFAVTGPRLWFEFAHHGLEVVTSNAVNRTFNFGLPSLLGNLTYAAYDFAPPESAVQWSRRAGIIAGLALIAAGYVVCLFGKQDRQRQFALLCCVMLAGGATMWGHYLVMLVFPAVVVLRCVLHSKTLLPKAIVAAALLIIWMAGTGTAPQLADYPLLNVSLHYLPLGAVLALAAVIGRELVRHSSEPLRRAHRPAPTALEGHRT